MFFAFIQSLNSIEYHAQCTIRTFSYNFVFIENVINLFAYCFILNTKQMHFTWTEIINFTYLLIGMGHVNVLCPIVTVMSSSVNTTIISFASRRKMLIY